ncbi:L-type lectin-domain containing receptor kinase IX.1 [Linum grandiflorum]
MAPKALSTLLLVIITLMIIPPSIALKFNFTTFTNDNQNITYEEAFPADDAIQLTKNLLGSDLKFSFGRATYRSPLPIWDPITKNLTDFQTHFTFSIFSQFKIGYGDGLAFFLAPKGSKLPTSPTEGGSMGLTRDRQQLNKAENRFVAVEFDIFRNKWDPEGKHVGIDLNSMDSAKTITWGGDIVGGRKSEAWIRYDSSSFNLSVAVTGFVGEVMLTQRISQIVDLRDYLPEEVTFGFSGSTGNQSAIHKVHTWEFESTLEVAKQGKNRGKNRVPLFIGSTGLVVGLLVLVSFLTLYRKKIFGGYDMDDDDDDEQHILDRKIMDEVLADGEEGGLRKFTFQELARATNNFDDIGNKLGEGGFGGVYRGYLKDKKDDVAVKRVSKKSRQGIREFAAEVKIINRLRHRNLVRLVGWCHEKEELLLVYEFLTNGSLDFHLFKQKDANLLLNWETRYKIAKGLASGLLYLHEEWEQCVVHRDIKSSNVMLDSNFGAKLGDFGLARLVDHDKSFQTTMLAGTIGYVAPECAMTGKASRETDIYSFGVVALEIATGRKPAVMVKVDENQCFVHLTKWVWDLYGARTMLEEGPDSRLGGQYVEGEMERLMIIGLCCSNPDPKLRPSIRQALQVLNFEAPLPILPMNMPVATFVSASSSMDGTTSTSLSSGIDSLTRSIDMSNTMAR